MAAPPTPEPDAPQPWRNPLCPRESDWLTAKECLQSADLWPAINLYVTRHTDPWEEPTCVNSAWILDDPTTWPDSVRADLSAQCDFTARVTGFSCGVVHWDRWPAFRNAGFLSPGDCQYSFWGPDIPGTAVCEQVDGVSLVAQNKCGPVGGAGGAGTLRDLAIASDYWDKMKCGCWTEDDFGASCVCGAASVSCTRTYDRSGGSICTCLVVCDSGAPGQCPDAGAARTVAMDAC